MISRVRAIVNDEGFSGLASRSLARAYRSAVRPLLPIAERLRYTGVVVARERRLFDRRLPGSFVGYGPEHEEGYEGTLVDALATEVREGDRVVIVGGGLGVTVVHAAWRAGPTGSVRCYEGSAAYARKVRRAARWNGVADRVTVVHAVVARAIAVYGTAQSSRVIPPTELPACDVLELDCEGAEIDILREMTIRPRAVLVETHGLYGAPTDLVRAALEALGYCVRAAGVAEERVRAFCEEHDIRILVGTRPHGPPATP
jgi:hypothetical protein